MPTPSSRPVEARTHTSEADPSAAQNRLVLCRREQPIGRDHKERLKSNISEVADLTCNGGSSVSVLITLLLYGDGHDEHRPWRSLLAVTVSFLKVRYHFLTDYFTFQIS